MDSGLSEQGSRLLRFCGTATLIAAMLSTDSAWGRHKTGMNPSQAPLTETKQLCLIQDQQIDEASGIAASIRHPQALWMHNDSGDAARLFLVDGHGTTRAICNLTATTAFDWEDMCSFELDGQPWLLVADVGDNFKRRGKTTAGATSPICKLLLVREPSFDVAEVQSQAEQVPLTVAADVHAVLNFTYEDGAHDCESVAVDTSTRQIFLVTKELPHKCSLHSIPLDLSSGTSNVVATRVCGLGIPFATAMDISADNSMMAIASPLNAILIHRTPEQSWIEACRTPGIPFALPARKQGETICFARPSTSVFVNSEGAQQPLWQVTLPIAATQP